MSAEHPGSLPIPTQGGPYSRTIPCITTNDPYRIPRLATKTNNGIDKPITVFLKTFFFFTVKAP